MKQGGGRPQVADPGARGSLRRRNVARAIPRRPAAELPRERSSRVSTWSCATAGGPMRRGSVHLRAVIRQARQPRHNHFVITPRQLALDTARYTTPRARLPQLLPPLDRPQHVWSQSGGDALGEKPWTAPPTAPAHGLVAVWNSVRSLEDWRRTATCGHEGDGAVDHSQPGHTYAAARQADYPRASSNGSCRAAWLPRAASLSYRPCPSTEPSYRGVLPRGRSRRSGGSGGKLGRAVLHRDASVLTFEDGQAGSRARDPAQEREVTCAAAGFASDSATIAAGRGRGRTAPIAEGAAARRQYLNRMFGRLGEDLTVSRLQPARGGSGRWRIEVRGRGGRDDVFLHVLETATRWPTRDRAMYGRARGRRRTARRRVSRRLRADDGREITVPTWRAVSCCSPASPRRPLRPASVGVRARAPCGDDGRGHERA